MPKNPVNDPITDQEIAFAHLIMSGTMDDRSAAEAAGLNPATAAYTKAKPRVQAYMAEHRAAVKQKLVDQHVEELIQHSIGRERILARLWELAMISPQVTRGSMTGQMKALSMIVAIEGLIPDRRLARVRAQPASAPAQPFVHVGKPHHEQPSASGAQQPNDQDRKQPAPESPQKSPAASAANTPPHSAFATAPTTPLNPFVHSIPASPAPLTLETAFDVKTPQYGELPQSLAARIAESRQGR